jgi:hypothetical protein
MLYYKNKMGGGLMQLVAYGAQDIYLTGNPQITFFKVVYRRHTNFSMESILQTFSGNQNFGGEVVATISRNGDLVGRMYLEHSATWPDDTSAYGVGLCERYGDSLIKEAEIEIGGQRIDKHTSMWNRVYSDLTEFNPTGYFGGNFLGNVAADTDVTGNGTLYQLMTGNGYGLNNASQSESAFSASGATVNGFTYTGDGDATNGKIVVNRIFLPLNFWFCRNPGLALPLIALQYHEVKVKLTFAGKTDLGRAVTDSTGEGTGTDYTGNPSSTKFDLYADYIYLDTDERRRFAQVSHEYLIEQLQISDATISKSTANVDLNFNHPVKELIWCTRNTGTDGRNESDNGSSGDITSGPVSLASMSGNWQLKLNGQDRFAARDSHYFTRTQIWQHHTGYGALPTFGDDASDLGTNGSATYGADSIAVYSFALKPEEHQPSGTCNFSRIDNAQLVGSNLKIETDGGATVAHEEPKSDGNDTMSLTIFAVNYNVLRIMSGMGGLAYSN